MQGPTETSLTALKIYNDLCTAYILARGREGGGVSNVSLDILEKQVGLAFQDLQQSIQKLKNTVSTNSTSNQDLVKESAKTIFSGAKEVPQEDSKTDKTLPAPRPIQKSKQELMKEATDKLSAMEYMAVTKTVFNDTAWEKAVEKLTLDQYLALSGETVLEFRLKLFQVIYLKAKYKNFDFDGDILVPPDRDCIRLMQFERVFEMTLNEIRKVFSNADEAEKKRLNRLKEEIKEKTDTLVREFRWNNKKIDDTVLKLK